MTSVFEGHEIVSIQDIIDGKVSIGHLSEKCSIHKQENKDMFCEDCKVHVCLKCVIVGHQNHNIKNQADFEQQLRLKVNDLVQRCAAKKTELEKNIQNVEVQRHEVYTAVQKLQEDVRQAYSIKAKRLEENHQNLIEEINAVKRSFDDDLSVMKSKDRQRIKSICSSISLVSNDRLGRLETDSLSAHTLLCEELDAMLKEATDHTSAAAITTKAHEKMFKPADDTRLDIGSISESDPKVQIIQCVDLQGKMWGVTQYSDDSVAIVYGDTRGIDIIDSAGKHEQYAHIPSNMKCCDLVFQQDRSLCISTGVNEAHLYSPNGSRKSTIRVKDNTSYSLKLNRSPSDEILIACCEKPIHIYDRTGSTLKYTVSTKHNVTRQVSATKSGLIITSSCNYSIDPSVVTVYDRDGNAGRSLQAPYDVHLYAAVDEQDRVYVASVDRKIYSNVVIRLYDLDGLNLKERVKDLLQRCAAKKTELEKNIQNVEVQRHEVCTAMQKLLDDVSQAYSIKVKELEANHQYLIEEINAVKRRFDDDLSVLKSKDRQRIKIICSSITLVSNDRLGRLETDSLSAHTLLCEELDAMLKEATDHTSAVAITKKAQEKRFKPADDTHLDLGSISEPDPNLQVIQCVDLRGVMSGMTHYSEDSVAIGYGFTHGIDIIDSAGKQEEYANIPSNMACLDLVLLQDRSLCVSTGLYTEAHIYYPNGSRKLTIHVNSSVFYLRLNRSPSDEILIANFGKQIYVYDPTGSTLKHTVSTKHNITRQVSATRSGLIVTSSCDHEPIVVTVYDRDGNAGKSLQAPSGVNLYAAVDEQDSVYVASVDRKNGNVVIRLYDLDGLNLKERVEFNALDLAIKPTWCYLVSLSPDMLAFACDKKLYFIKVSL
eukprot:XP_011678679.1 PREDICTED: uncharacterized protein LOC105445175 [Strongylocentrotus purpuratus]